MPKTHNSIWWGPPRKFTNRIEDRKISWLELFFDLVYAVVISRTTHGLAVNATPAGILDYAYLIIIIFWGWYNGSQYYDLHGTAGIRTRLMTLWQMMIVAALAVTFGSPADKLIWRVTIAIATLQIYITYLWWSVGIYDKEHRKYNTPYTVCYLIAFALIILTLFIPQPYKRMLFWVTLVLNYIPPFLSATILKSDHRDFSLSTSMTERLGTFTIILFGEAILGVINGVPAQNEISFVVWFCFGLGILTVFALWWIFFALIADRQSREGMARGSTTAIVYILALASLGMIGASFPGLMNDLSAVALSLSASRIIFGVSIALFLSGIVALSTLLVYTKEYHDRKRPVQLLLLGVALLDMAVTTLVSLPLTWYLLWIFLSLAAIIVIITKSWVHIEIRRGVAEEL
ncbi:MAG TPA: low temperature requirement protein A [Mucilaginibacter sp.]|jgi:low temperature requirement protein LtrA|nr:low temperature requirement protein A [Mucilaginibacter sp.]